MAGNLYIVNHKQYRCIERGAFTIQSKKIATLLSKKGIKRNDTIAILMRNDPQYFSLIEACRYLGAYFVPLNWHSVFTDIEHIVADSGASLLVAHSDLLLAFEGKPFGNVPVLTFTTSPEIQDSFNTEINGHTAHTSTYNNIDAELPHTLPINQPCEPFRGMFAYTSGSTGRPKGIKRLVDDSANDKYAVYQSLASSLMQLQPQDRFLVAAPIYHSAPNTLTICCLAAQDIDVFIATKFDAESFLHCIETHKITHMYIVPTMMIRLLKLPADVRKKYDVSSLKYALSTGSACPVEVKAAMIAWFGPIFFESYGASEIGFMTLISSQQASEKPGSVGKVVPGGDIKILNEHKQEMAIGESGLIYIDLPMFGAFKYTNAEEKSEDISFERYITVGDIGYVDQEGFLFINDRQKDMIISGGVNIFPLEIEAVLIEMEQIIDCAVIGAAHAEFGEMVVAAVQCQPEQSLTLAQIHDFLEGKLAKYKFPRKLDIHVQLPREESGKIFKQKLRAQY